MDPENPRTAHPPQDRYRPRYESAARELHTLQDLYQMAKGQIALWWHSTLVLAVVASISFAKAIGWPLWFGLIGAAILVISVIELDRGFRKAERLMSGEGEDL